MRPDDSIEFHCDGADIVRDWILADKEMPASAACIGEIGSQMIAVIEFTLCRISRGDERTQQNFVAQPNLFLAQKIEVGLVHKGTD
jgi:hypothetical protein